jgi:hypothetical protein
MKTIYLLAAFIGIAISAGAQVNMITTTNSIPNSVGPKAKIIGTSAGATVYALPQDNMPCLVPNTATVAKMPVMRAPLANPGIPNAMPRQDLLATAFPLKNDFKPAKFEIANSKNLMLDLVRKK